MDGSVFKKSLQVIATFGLLLAGYASYDRAFALVATQIQSAQVLPVKPFEPQQPRYLKQAIELASRAFGADHWSANPSKEMFRFYNVERGYWMYATNYERQKDGKLLIFWPFALIWVSRDGKDLKTATSDKAYILLDQAFDIVVKPGGGGEMRVVNARLEGNVRLRDDKGTANADDDLRISGQGDEGLTYVEYDEAKQKITHDSFVTIEDGDMRVSGKGIEIVLRPKETANAGSTTKPAGFDGAQTIFLRKDVRILIKDVGRSGVMPGTAPAGPKQGAKTPLNLRCDGLARFDLPKPRPPLLPWMAGPPTPSAPTFAEFDRNVEVVRGKLDETPERMLCDHLRLTFLPTDKPAPAAPANSSQVTVAEAKTKTARPQAKAAAPSGEGDDETEPEEARGPLASLALHEAHATGHAVELISPAQGVKVRQCNELIYTKVPGKNPGETDDETYLRTDLTQKLLVEKLEIPIEGPDKGKVMSVTQVRCVDAKIFQNGAQSDQATIVARGPGILETRPALDKPVDRTAVWNDELIYRPIHNEQGELRKQITLTDSPKFHDIQAQTTLDARRILVVYLRPKAPESISSQAPAEPKTQGGTSAAESFEIDKLVALEDVHLNSPGRYLTAVDRLDAWFQPAPPLAREAPAAQPAPDGNAKFVVTGDPFAEEKPADPAQAKDPKGAEKPADPDVFVKANRVWANILMRPTDEAEANPAGGAKRGAGAAPGALPGSGKSKGELQRVYMAGAVSFHQDPAPGEAKGTDITGEACHGLSMGNGLWQFQVHDQEPTQDKVFPNGQGARRELMALPPARVANKDMSIEGPTIGLDQPADKVWVVGPGKLVMMTERDLLSDKETAATPPGSKEKANPKVVKIVTPPPAGNGKDQADDKAKPPVKKVPVTITWTTEMDFYGQSQDPSGRPTARAEFFSDPKEPVPAHFKDPIRTRAETENGLLVCQDMKVYFDRPIKLAKLRTAPGARPDPAEEPEPKHDIDLIECFENVVAIARKVDESNRLVQQERVEGNELVYDKITGNFRVPGAGVVKYWNVKGEGQETQPGGSSPLTPPSRTITRTANPPNGAQVARRAGGRPGVEPKKGMDAKKGAEAKKTAGPPRRQLELTVIKFEDRMQGRFLPGKEGEREPRTADFFGNVEALHAPVADTGVKFNFDKPPADYSHITAQTMRLVSEPPQADAPPDSPARTYMQAYDNAFVRRDDATIQADKITYDSEKDLFWAYGYEGRQVTIKQFKGIGQSPSITEGRAAYFVHKTGEAQIIDPQQFQLVDLKTGTRPTPDKVGAAKRAVRPKRSRMPNQNNVERRTFNGK